MNKLSVHGGLVADASLGGFLIHSVKDIPVGAVVGIVVLFSKGFEMMNLEAIAKIAWKDIHWEAAWEGYKYGLDVIQISEESCQRLKQILNGRIDEEIPEDDAPSA